MCVGGNTPLNTELSAMVSLNNQLALGTYAPGSAGRVPHSPSLSAPLAHVESTLTAEPLPQPRVRLFHTANLTHRQHNCLVA